MIENIEEHNAQELESAAAASLGEAADMYTLKEDEDANVSDTIVLGDTSPEDAALEERVIAEDSVWSGSIFDVNRLEVELPNGRLASRDVVRHPGAVAIVALTSSGQICLVRQWRAALGRVSIEIPAGKLAPGEDPKECAARELQEETGFKAQNIAYLTTIAPAAGFADELIHMYMATGLELVGAHPDEDEFINVELVDASELVDAVLDGRIEDAKTVIGALLCDAISRRLSATDELAL